MGRIHRSASSSIVDAIVKDSDTRLVKGSRDSIVVEESASGCHKEPFSHQLRAAIQSDKNGISIIVEGSAMDRMRERETVARENGAGVSRCNHNKQNTIIDFQNPNPIVSES